MSKISVVGSMNVDIAVKTGRVPNDGETVMGNDIKINPGGKGANQAIAAARLGGDVKMFGCIGNDNYGKLIRDTFIKEGVNCEYVKTVSNISTGAAVIIVTKNDNRITAIRGANSCADIPYINSVRDKILDSDIVLLQNEIPLETIEYVINICHNAGVPVILNPAPALPLKRKIIDMAEYIVPNEHEVSIVFDTDKNFDEILLSCPKKLIVTLGKNGVSYCDGNAIVNIPAIEATRVDSTGAGDTFLGAFAKAVADGESTKEAIVFAQYASGLSIEKFGAQAGMPTLEEVNERRRMNQ